MRVVVGDDHPVYREGVVRALSESGSAEVVADVENGRSALEAIRNLHPDIALLDYRMPQLDGLAVAHAVMRDGLSVRVLILSVTDDSATVYRALAEGASGFITKESSRQEIVDAVISCARGNNVLPSHLAGALASEIRQRARGDATLLTKRELQVVQLIALGRTVAQIAEELFLAPTTIKSHIQKLYEKLGVSDRGSAVAVAMRRKLLE
ncbi:response regulator transcription factor [Rhodococcus erythropolis]|uniref:response regulator transcription factor n=1 Tax=Rhodococcus erythropolis TaxID=1833 RepID=UPI0029496FD8|nr:response regulator transcription factor [Rhodococcus erythropolis]MDV6278657.1 response regulator transcription factor [Rhodococcus erythropolis]